MLKKILLFIPSIIFCITVHTYGQSGISTGTGFLISNNGLIVTCAHVVEGGKKITINIDKKEYNAEVLVISTNTDLAILKIDFQSPYYFKIANLDSINLGDKVFVLGYPLSGILGSDIRVTDGIVSAKSGINSDPTYFQISAPIQPGNSGGPIVNEKFEIIGIAAAKLNDIVALEASGSIPQNVNFGVKSSYIGPLLDNFNNNSTSIRSISNATRATVQIISQSTPPQNSLSLQIVNRTGYTVYYVYVSPVTSDSWGTDKMGENVLGNGAMVSIPLLPLNDVNQYDIRLVDKDGDSYTKRNIRISQNSRIEFTINDYDAPSQSSSNPSPGQAPSSSGSGPSNPSQPESSRSFPNLAFSYFELGYNYEFNMPVGFTIGILNAYTSWNFVIPDDNGYEESYYSYNPEDGSVDDDTWTFIDLGQRQYQGFEWTVGFKIPVMINKRVLLLPIIGIGGNHTQELRLFDQRSSYSSFGKEWLPPRTGWTNRLVLEAGLQIVLKWFYVSGTYRVVGFERSSFTIGSGISIGSWW